LDDASVGVNGHIADRAVNGGADGDAVAAAQRRAIAIEVERAVLDGDLVNVPGAVERAVIPDLSWVVSRTSSITLPGGIGLQAQAGAAVVAGFNIGHLDIADIAVIGDVGDAVAVVVDLDGSGSAVRADAALGGIALALDGLDVGPGDLADVAAADAGRVRVRLQAIAAKPVLLADLVGEADPADLLALSAQEDAEPKAKVGSARARIINIELLVEPAVLAVVVPGEGDVLDAEAVNPDGITGRPGVHHSRVVVDPEAVAVGRLSSRTRRDGLAEAVVVELVVRHGASSEVAAVGDADAVVEVLPDVIAVEGHILDPAVILHADPVTVAAGPINIALRYRERRKGESPAVLPAVAVDHIANELDIAHLGDVRRNVDAIALSKATSSYHCRRRAILRDALSALGIVADGDILAEAAAVVELDPVAGVLVDDVAVNQQVADLDDASIEEDTVRPDTWCRSTSVTTHVARLTISHDGVVYNSDLLDRAAVAEVDGRCVVVTHAQEVRVISLNIRIEGVAVDDHVAVQAAAADRPNSVTEDQTGTTVLEEGVPQDADGVDRCRILVVEDHALFPVVEEAVVLDGDVLLGDACAGRCNNETCPRHVAGSSSNTSLRDTDGNASDPIGIGDGKALVRGRAAKGHAPHDDADQRTSVGPLDDGGRGTVHRAHDQVLHAHDQGRTTYVIDAIKDDAGVARSGRAPHIRAARACRNGVARDAGLQAGHVRDLDLGAQRRQSARYDEDRKKRDDSRPHVRSLAQLQFVPPSLFGVELPIR
jgi:hypothetical protein